MVTLYDTMVKLRLKAGLKVLENLRKHREYVKKLGVKARIGDLKNNISRTRI